MLLEHGEELGGDQLDAVAAKLLGDFGRLLHVPVLLEAPVNDRLFDPAVLDGTVAGWTVLGHCLAPQCGQAEHGRTRGLLEHRSATAPPRPFWTLPDLTHDAFLPVPIETLSRTHNGDRSDHDTPV